MKPAKIPATLIAVTTYVIASGIFTQGGVILKPAAAYFHAPLTDTALLFSFMSAGNLAGILISIAIFNVLSIRQVLLCAYLCLFAGVAAIVAFHQLPLAFAAAFAIGLGVGTGLSSGAVILAKLYVDRVRAVAFLSTDCAFSGTGFVIPAVAAAAIAAQWRWQSGYLVVAGIAAAALLAAQWIAFPPTGRAPERDGAPAEPRRRGAFVTIALFALGVAAYITGQTTFTLWAPAVLQDVLGVPALQAGTIVSSFFGPSSLGLVTAAFVVSRVPPRAVLAFALVMGTVLTLTLALLTNAHAFFLVTFAFGFTTTCMYKIMISIGSEQLPASPPSLVTFLLLCSGVGTTAAPIVSAQAIKLAGLHASLWVAFAFHAATLVVVLAALATERAGTARLPAGTPARTASGQA